jgi:hypothetical protein
MAAPSAEDIRQTTEAVKAATELAKTADPLVRGLLQVFISTAQTVGLGPALNMLPSGVRSKLQGKIKPPPGRNLQAEQKKKKSSSQPQMQMAKGGVPKWAWIVGGVAAVGGVGFLLTRKKKR